MKAVEPAVQSQSNSLFVKTQQLLARKTIYDLSR